VPAAAQRRRIDDLLGLVGLADAGGRQIRKYSKGMQQRLGIAQALLSEPALVVLDEPMSGLDPVGRKEVRDLILELKRRGTTVFFSTHILPDVETVCDRVAVIMKGTLRDVGRIGDLLSPSVRSVEMTLELTDGGAERVARGRLLAREGARATVIFDDEAAADAALAALVRSGDRVVSLTRHRETLEDFFLRRLAGAEAEKASGAGPAGRP
jgi:ABC-2 type transport system ATP-binding protein